MIPSFLSLSQELHFQTPDLSHSLVVTSNLRLLNIDHVCVLSTLGARPRLHRLEPLELVQGLGLGHDQLALDSCVCVLLGISHAHGGHLAG